MDAVQIDFTKQTAPECRVDFSRARSPQELLDLILKSLEQSK